MQIYRRRWRKKSVSGWKYLAEIFREVVDLARLTEGQLIIIELQHDIEQEQDQHGGNDALYA